MSIVETTCSVTGGVDTHAEVRMAAVVDQVGGVLGVRSLADRRATRDVVAAAWKYRVVVPWSDFALAVPALAAFGADRLLRPPAYLATVTGDGGARVHPVTPILSATGLYVFIEPTSPKGRDLRERRRFAMHNGVPDTEGSGGEFFLSGEGMAVDDDAVRAGAVAAASYEPADRYVLFELLVGSARANGYGDVTLPEPSRWSAGTSINSARTGVGGSGRGGR